MPVFFKQNPHLVNKVWGGNKLSYKSSPQGIKEPIGESWELSCLPEGQSTFQDKELGELLTREKQLKFLVKIIDTSDNLSVQVHPDDMLAAQLEGSSGKTECWYILSAEKDAKIYLGLKPGVTKEKFQQAIDSQEEAHLLMNSIEAKPGRFFFVPAGQLHAIGKDVTLIEIQQSSGITYRLWDWNRLGLDGKPRELHIEKGLKALKNLPVDFLDIKHEVEALYKLTENEFFSVFLGEVKKGERRNISLEFDYGGVTCLSGELQLYDGEDVTILKSWETAFIKKDRKNKIEIGSSKEARFVLSYQP